MPSQLHCPGDGHVARMAQPILDRVAASRDGSERKWVEDIRFPYGRTAGIAVST